MRDRLRAFINHPRVQALIIVLILVNAVLLGLETSPAVMAAAGQGILLVDRQRIGPFANDRFLHMTTSAGMRIVAPEPVTRTERGLR